jgi:hypothetical protein
MAVVQTVVIFWSLHFVIIKCLRAFKEHNDCTFKVSELVLLDAEVMQWKKMFWLHRKV